MSDFLKGFHRFEQYSRIGLTKAVKALNKTDLFLDLKQFKIIEAFRLALLQVSLMWGENDKFFENFTPKSKTSFTLSNGIEFTE